MKTRSRARRGVALGVAVVLITSGIAGVTATHGVAAAKITSALAILVGLGFLNMARAKRSS